MIGSLPTGRIDVVTVTVPVVGLTGPDPRVWPPLVTVMVTGLPAVLGPDVVTVTVGVSLLTVCTTDAVAVLLFASPL